MDFSLALAFVLDDEDWVGKLLLTSVLSMRNGSLTS